jgi:hypothetical protein
LSKGSHVVARNIALAAALLAIGVLRTASAADPFSSPAVRSTAPQATPPPRLLDIDKNSALILIRTTLIAVQQANQTGNYSVLYALSSPDFQKVNSPERLSQIFAKLRAKNLDLSGVLVLEPQFTVLPEIYSNGIMRMVGFFPSVPMQVYFQLQFAPVQGQWRAVAIAVDIGGATPTAPIPNPALASSYSPTPTPTPTPSATATPSRPTIEVQPGAKVTPAAHKTATPGARNSLGRTQDSGSDH